MSMVTTPMMAPDASSKAGDKIADCRLLTTDARSAPGSANTVSGSSNKTEREQTAHMLAFCRSFPWPDLLLVISPAALLSVAIVLALANETA